jgi:hypothetical protein
MDQAEPLYDWYHPVFGKVLQTSVSDLVKMFPDQDLDPEQLRQLAETGFCDGPA